MIFKRFRHLSALLALFCAQALAAHLDATLSLEDAPGGGMRVRVALG